MSRVRAWTNQAWYKFRFFQGSSAPTPTVAASSLNVLFDKYRGILTVQLPFGEKCWSLFWTRQPGCRRDRCWWHHAISRRSRRQAWWCSRPRYPHWAICAHNGRTNARRLCWRMEEDPVGLTFISGQLHINVIHCVLMKSLLVLSPSPAATLSPDSSPL